MYDSIKFLSHIFPLRKLNSILLLCISLAASLIEIGIFFIAAASLEFFLFNKPDGLTSAIGTINKYVHVEVSLLHFLVLGCLLATSSVLLNFSILAVIRAKVIQMGVVLQTVILEPYLKLELNFANERNNKIDLKVFAESLIVITEGIFLQIYLAISRFLIIIIYTVFGLFLIGPTFLIMSLFVALLFALSLVAFSYRIRSLTENINILGERRLRILTNFVAGRVDIVFFGLPGILLGKLEMVLQKLLQNKISIMTEVHKPRIVIEGSLILFMIALGIYRVQNPDINLSSTEILSFLLVLRLLPALQQFTSNIRAAAAASWAVNDLRELLSESKEDFLEENQVSPWDCKINFHVDETEWFSVEARRCDGDILGSSLVLKPGVVNVIKGPSGVGKSTLLKTIMERFQVHDEWDKDLKRMVSYLPQDPITLLTTFEQNVLMGELDGTSLLIEDFEAVGFDQDWISKFDRSVSQDYLIVSGGEAQRIALLRCLYGKQKRIFLFDEPTSALDSELEGKATQLIEALARKGYFVALVSHNDLKIEETYLNEILL